MLPFVQNTGSCDEEPTEVRPWRLLYCHACTLKEIVERSEAHNEVSVEDGNFVLMPRMPPTRWTHPDSGAVQWTQLLIFEVSAGRQALDLGSSRGRYSGNSESVTAEAPSPQGAVASSVDAFRNVFQLDNDVFAKRGSRRNLWDDNISKPSQSTSGTWADFVNW